MQNLEKGNLPESQGNNQLDNNQAGNLQPDKPISPGFYFTFILFRYKYLIIFLVVAATVTSIFIAKSLPNMYSSTASLVPPKGTGSMLQGALGSISTALKDIGVTKLGSKGDLSYSFIVLLDNRTVKDSIISKFKLAEVYEMQNEKPTSVRAAFNENLLLKVTADGNYTITVTDKDPQRACDIAKAYAGMVDSVASELFQRENRINRIHLENRIKQTDSVINESAALTGDQPLSSNMFDDILNKTIEALNGVSKSEFHANQMIDRYAHGEVELHDVMVAQSKMNVMVQMAVTTINGAVSTFKEITQMQI